MKMALVNDDPHDLKQRALSLISTKRERLCSYTQTYLNMKKGPHQVVRRKSREKCKLAMLVSALTKEDQTKVVTLTDSKVEMKIMTTHSNEAGSSGTRLFNPISLMSVLFSLRSS